MNVSRLPLAGADPLTPADCDMTGLPFMPMDLARVMDSDMFALSTGEEFKAAFALWAKAWSQRPAGSLPKDDRVLARFVGVSLSEWMTLAPMALRNWIECSDGRLYHPVVCEKALQAWIDRLAFQKRSAAGNAKKYNHPFDPTPWVAAITTAHSMLTRLSGTAANSTRRAVAVAVGGQKAPTGSDESSLKEPSRSAEASLSTPSRDEKSSEVEVEDEVEGEGTSKEGTPSKSAPRRGAGRGSSASPTTQEQAAFDGFWAVYPLHKGKAPALEAFLRVLRGNAATIEQIMHGAQAYAGERAGKDPSKTKYAQGWLNDQRWEDEQILAAAARPAAYGPKVF
jgi:hypothetical protein